MTRLSVNNPAAVIVAVVLVALFGMMALRELPIQLLPDVERPQISIWTGWRAAAPEEVEESIVQPQEKVLKHVPGLENMVSFVSRGQGFIVLEFRVGWDMQAALIDVITQLNQAEELPIDASDSQVVQGMLEGSNVIAVAEITRMIELLRSYEAAQQLIIRDEEREQQAIEILTRTA